ncbi:MAG: endonuclease/exonuclease/phosphatase family protein [Elusimicrobia bacterium]|nr:endonuclease/exonuclease/phosphatase family protein [Elusimicrobiota bacterium]
MTWGAAAALAAAGLVQAASRPPLSEPARPRPRIVSLNVAGIPVVHPRLSARLRAIGEELKAGGYDVAALQEVWRSADARRLGDAAGLPYRARPPQARPFGDGLLLLSRFPILESRELRFSSRSDRWRLLDGELFAHKGAQLARIAAPGGPWDVYNAHLVADYAAYGNPETRLSQARELAEWIWRHSPGRPVILAGDLNMTRGDPAYRLLAGLLRLQDACDAAGRDACAGSRGERRIDFILLPAGSARPLEAGVAFSGVLEEDGRSYRLSDHLGIAVRLGVAPAPLSGAELAR